MSAGVGAAKPRASVSSHTDRRAEYCDGRVCLSVCVRLSVRDHIFRTTWPIFTKFLCMFLCMLPTGHCSVLLWRRYVLPVLSMTSYLLKSQGCWGRRRPAKAQCTRSLGLGYKLCAIIPVAGQRTHLTTFRALKVTSQVAATGAESAVYVCLVGRALRGCFIVSLVSSIAPDV